MLHLEWTEAERKQWHRYAAEHRHSVREALRLEMLRRLAAGQSVETIATHLGVSPKCVRRWIGRYRAHGLAGLRDLPRAGHPVTLTADHLAAVRALLAQGGRTWTAAQLADWLATQHDVRLSAAQLAVRLRAADCAYQRTVTSLAHRQDAAAVAASTVELAALEAQGDAGECDVAYFDQAGCSLTLPTRESWTVRGEPLAIPVVAPQGRRVNVVGAYISHGPAAGTLLTETAVRFPLPKHRTATAMQACVSAGLAAGAAVAPAAPVAAAPEPTGSLPAAGLPAAPDPQPTLAAGWEALPAAQAATAAAAAVVAAAERVTTGFTAAWAGAEAAVATAEQALEAVQHAARRVELAQAAQRHGVAWWDFGVCTAAVLLAFLYRLAGRPLGAPEDWRRERPLWVVLDNYSVHRCRAVQAARPALEAANIHLYYLPPYSPELNRIEGVWRTVKYTDLTRRSYDHLGEYRTAVQDALQSRAAIIREKHAAKTSQNLHADP